MCHRDFKSSKENWLEKLLPPRNAANQSNPSSPAVLTVCHTWSAAEGGVSEATVLEAVNSSSELQQLLRLKLGEERDERLKMEHLSNFHEQEQKKLCQEPNIDWVEYVSLVTEAEDETRITESKFSSS